MGELPRGTVTFLFTDIAGSARLWERAADVMPAALERHNVLIRAAVERNAGYLFKLTADGCCAAFAIAPAALAAAVDAQRALQAETWPASTPLRVRAAIHSGAAEEHDGDYFGPAVNRTARLLDAAHSGQTLLSFAARELACDTLPPDVTLRDLGMHRLRDLTRPEQIFQLVDTGLPTEFPTLRTLDAYRHNLPAQPNAIVGRGREIDNVCALLRRDDVRLVTLTGPGGVGKTRLALQLGAELAGSADGRFADGVVFVDLSPVSDTSLVASAILRALGLQEKGETPPRELLALVLRERATLLVLDNFEQVLDAAGLVRALLDAAPRLHVLVTSRAPLRLYGEREYPVSPLDLPDPQGVTPERLTQYDAVRLFIERAQAARPGFAVDNASAPTVAEICTRLDGLPLAIELAAARVRLFAPQALLARLGNRLATLTGGPRDVPARQQTLRATIAWSYDLLSVGEQVRFARLAVFVGGFDVAAAEQVCGAGIDDLDALASQSLLLIRAGADGEPRFAMLETVREYSLERLADSGHADMLRDLHAAHFLALAEQAENNLYGPAQKHWFERLAEEHDNLRAAFDHLTAQADYAGALRLGAALSYFWRVRGHYAEGRRRLDSALDRLLDASPARASALCGAGALAQENGAYADARQYYEQGARLAAQSGDRSAEATALRGLGLVAIELGDYTRSYVHFERALAICRATGDRHSIAQTMDAIGRAQSDRGELAAARRRRRRRWRSTVPSTTPAVLPG